VRVAVAVEKSDGLHVRHGERRPGRGSLSRIGWRQTSAGSLRLFWTTLSGKHMLNRPSHPSTLPPRHISVDIADDSVKKLKMLKRTHLATKCYITALGT
jgi:hypothetical protein